MVEFIISQYNDDECLKIKNAILQNKYEYPDILYTEVKFDIIIDGSLFFSEPNFPILEFLKEAVIWLRCPDESKEMIYNSIETEDNPLISFVKQENGWIIVSPWQENECCTVLSKQELVQGLQNLMGTIQGKCERV